MPQTEDQFTVIHYSFKKISHWVRKVRAAMCNKVRMGSLSLTPLLKMSYSLRKVLYLSKVRGCDVQQDLKVEGLLLIAVFTSENGFERQGLHYNI
jgi:hypothetical protein